MQTAVAVAAAWKSAFSRAALPLKPPVRTSAVRLPWVVKGLVPVSEPRRTRRVTVWTAAPSGIAAVSNERMPRYCRSCWLSPARRALVPLSLLLVEPPTLVFSPDSRT